MLVNVYLVNSFSPLCAVNKYQQNNKDGNMYFTSIRVDLYVVGIQAYASVTAEGLTAQFVRPIEYRAFFPMFETLQFIQ